MLTLRPAFTSCTCLLRAVCLASSRAVQQIPASSAMRLIPALGAPGPAPTATFPLGQHAMEWPWAMLASVMCLKFAPEAPQTAPVMSSRLLARPAVQCLLAMLASVICLRFAPETPQAAPWTTSRTLGLSAAQRLLADAGLCGEPEVCDGASKACPADVKKPSGTICRPSAGCCDSAERCCGTSKACPVNTFAPATTVCLQTAGHPDSKLTVPPQTQAPCPDISYYCSGTSAQCPYTVSGP
jgi:hypothetical protein